MNKTLIFCADGTWNGPNQDDDNDGSPDFTNVYKLFLGLEGELSPETLRNADEQEKWLMYGVRPVQIAKYIHGVGDSRNPIHRIIGGAFGAGIIARIVRGYTFISRNYEDGDSIILVGFSRGAYTVRALAGLIASEGLLAKKHTNDKEHAYRMGAKAWYEYRKNAKRTDKRSFLKRFAEVMADLPAFLSAGDINKEKDLVSGFNKIKAVAVWDTVGAMGLPNYEDDSRVDAFRFTNDKLSENVEWGFHAIALDEQRLDFTHTKWADRKNVVQFLFPGAHADIGGGYPTKNKESGLSNGALLWMVDRLKELDVKFKEQIKTLNPADASGVAHQPWLYKPFKLIAKLGYRNFSGADFKIHESVNLRKQLTEVKADPSLSNGKYAPKNLI